MDRSLALIQYWRNCLADVDLRSPETKDAFDGLELADILRGQLPQSLAEKIFRAAQQEERQRRKGDQGTAGGGFRAGQAGSGSRRRPPNRAGLGDSSVYRFRQSPGSRNRASF